MLRHVPTSCLLVFSACLLALWPVGALWAETLTVPGDYSTIRAAIDHAESGDTISVKAGTYNERITLKAGLTLEGEEAPRTVINGGGSGTVIVAANNSTIRKLTIRNGTTGVVAENLSSLTLSKNIIVDHVTGVLATAISDLDILNNVIARNNTGIDCLNTDAQVQNNTLDDNDISGVSCADSQNVVIRDNLVTHNGVGIALSNITTLTVTHNGYHGNNANGEEGEDDEDAIKPADPPVFADPAGNDYHLRSATPSDYLGGDAGSPADDLGAYGGAGATDPPFPIAIVSTSRGTDSLTVNWTPNLAYNVTGYKIYANRSKSHAAPDDECSAGTCPCTAAECSRSFSGLDNSVVTPGAPALHDPLIVTGGLQLAWDAPANAQDLSYYDLYWGTASGSYGAAGSPQNVGGATSHRLSGLTNNVTYFISVKAVAEPRYFVSVTAVDHQGLQSTLFQDVEVALDNKAEGAFSNEVQGTPEEIVGILLDQGGCFIATAAYGSPLERQVVILREFRDRYLLPTSWGRAFVAFYYEHSPPLARFIEQREWAKGAVRLGLLPLWGLAWLLLETSALQKLFLLALLSAPLFLWGPLRRRISGRPPG